VERYGTAAPATGLATLWPYRQLGTHEGGARHAVGAPAYRNAHGWAVRTADGLALPVSGGANSARKRAMVLGGGVTYEAIAVGPTGTVLFAARERITAPACGCGAHVPAGGVLVGVDGLLLKGQGNPRNSVVFGRIVSNLTGALSRSDAAWVRPYLERYLDGLSDVDWPNATGAQADKAWARAQRVLRRANVSELIPTWVAHVRSTGETTARGTRRAVRGEFLPRVGVQLSQRELTAMARIGAQSGWWVRDEMGRRSDRLTQRARGIVQRGIRDGLGRDQIASDLQNQIPGLWKQYGHNYARVTAAVATARARSYASLTSYQTASIEWVEIVAVHDERTTEVCRFMDGQILPVGQSIELLDAGASVQDPEDIRTVNPFMQVRSDRDTRQQYIQTTTGVRVADVLRSGVGSRDDRGQHLARLMGSQLIAEASVGVPPYHFGCRSTDVPRTDLFQVPLAMPMRSVGIPAREPPAVIPQAIRPAPSPGVTPTPRPAAPTAPAARAPAPGRPVQTFDAENRAWELGEPPPGDIEAFSDWGWRQGIAMIRQVPPRVDQARKAITEAVTKAAEAANRAISPQKSGEVVLEQFEETVHGGVKKAVDRVRSARTGGLQKAATLPRDRAAAWQRDRWASDGEPLAVGDGVTQVPGRWYDPWCGRLGVVQQLTAPIEDALVAGDTRTIGDAWNHNPDHVAFVLAYLGGAWDEP